MIKVLHEDWGTTPAAIDCCLRIADEHDIQVTIHTDTLNESAFVEDTIAAFKGRTIHTYHSEGAGGRHAPDIIRICGEPASLRGEGIENGAGVKLRPPRVSAAKSIRADLAEQCLKVNADENGFRFHPSFPHWKYPPNFKTEGSIPRLLFFITLRCRASKPSVGRVSK